MFHFPVFYGENGEPIITPETTEHVAKLVEEFGSDVWFEREAKIYYQKDSHIQAVQMVHYKKKWDYCGRKGPTQVAHTLVYYIRPELTFPADLYLEDQTNTVDGSTRLTTSVRQFINKLHIKRSFSRVRNDGKARRWVNL